MSSRLHRLAPTSLFTISFLGIVILLNVISSRHSFRIDLTPDRQYTLSGSTQRILQRVDDTLLIKLYFSKDLPAPIAHLRQETKDFLEEYRRTSHQKIQIQEIDPAESPEEEKKIQALGVPSVELSLIEKDQRELKKIYLGIGLFFEDKIEIIPVVGDTKNLEYQLTSAILKLSTKDLKKVALLTGNPSQVDKEYGGLKNLLEKSYQVDVIDPSQDEILSDKNFATLIVARPENLSEGLLLEIDQFIMKGGHAIFLLERVKVDPQLNTTPLNTNVEDLVEHYGVRVNPNLIADRSNSPATFATGPLQYQIPYPFWVKVVPPGLDPKNLITERLSSLILPWTSSLDSIQKDTGEAKIQFLLKTTPAGWEQSEPFTLQPQALSARPDVGGDVLSLAALIMGPLKSAYDGREPPLLIKHGGKDQPRPSNDLIKRTENAMVLVVGNARFIDDAFLKLFEDNFAFVLNAVDWMTLGDDLIGIRTKVLSDRPLIELTDGERRWIKNLNTYGIPVIVLLLGAAYNLRLKRVRNNLAQEFS